MAGRCSLAAWAMAIVVLLAGCDGRPWNNPYPASEDAGNILYASFEERPKHLDPARAYSATEYEFIAQIYEPPLQYHYLKRPYTLVPLTAQQVPEPYYLDQQGKRVRSADDARAAYTVYQIDIRPGIRYQPHPAFARDAAGQLLYHHLKPEDLASRHTLADFPERGARELVAEDYVYQIKRLAHPQINSPILGIMSEYIVGLRDYAATLEAAYQRQAAAGGKPYLDLRDYPLAGVQVLGRYSYSITLQGKYPQLLYWLAMPFFAPLPQEVEHFYAQDGMAARNITLDWYPVGTGPYQLTVNNPNRQMVLERNPNFHGESYPAEGDAGDREAGLLADAGRPLPFVDRVVFSLEKESIPYWNKFLQGYYDRSGISSDNFDQAIRTAGDGDMRLTDAMVTQGIRLNTAVNTSTMYIGFNMIDSVVGGLGERQRKLRQALSIALDYEEFISIFANGRGLAAQGPLPPGIFGYRDGASGINPQVYDWIGGMAQRKSLEVARQLLVEAGYPGGLDAISGRPLVLHLDIPASSGPDDKARLDWYRKQFRKLNIQLIIRNTDYNRFLDKMDKGNAQIYIWGWNADYPDPENFLFLLYGPNGKVKYHGENASNYHNAEFDRLFEQMKNMANGPERQRIIDQMLQIARVDAPWIWGMHPKSFALSHRWYHNSKPNLMANNTLKYVRIDPGLRSELRRQWNRPVVWPVWVMVAGVLLLIVPALIAYRRRERHAPTHGTGRD
ncbi:MAG: ABC transporter substrate-binding protein [Gammaproteobacteria bacterium]|nr:ABC transporter substrate-binding protein [Gammaproteobacteria bacterium]